MPTPHIDCPSEKSDMTPCVLRDGELAADDRGCCVGCGERIDKIAPQTGGGDARERLVRDICPNDFGQGPCDYPACRDSRCEFWKSGDKITAALRSSHREAMEAPFTKALVAEARTQGYQEGAEAMREALRGACEDKPNWSREMKVAADIIRGRMKATADIFLARMGALPIPGNKTDAG